MKALPAQSDSSIINEQSLGHEWTRSALGEHASIASFAAFSIALMTNGAPSNLVQDALKAALDEVRHARTSFAIASKLRGQHIVPGSLPESKHEFGHDLKALAIAVAKEGCIDETLSALDAAYKAELIGYALETELESTEYSGIDKDTLVWIQKELNMIAMDESRHSSLAWRTLNWICNVDSEACDEVKTNILNDDKLEQAFHHRFGSADNLQIMQLWREHYLEDCIEGEDVEVDFYDLLSEAARNLMIRSHAATNSTRQ
uniref:Ferritin-like domain-containing protein n=1 Tax=Skeletonema marinoi TaxID=267567 RepID=A0A7S2P940_9STRA|mmetsp:Transcript_16261/g.27464  ORF Transcript_16261/g.27464 Transcript_16261/m.27464 type:complete len:260 (+) Transcript_16261:1064-1843(+)